MALDMKIVTYRDIFQHETGKTGQDSDEYHRINAQILLDKKDMEGLGVSDGAGVLVENDAGKVILVARASEESHPGIAFMVRSPWSNQLEEGEPCRPGAPTLGGISARVAPSEDAVTTLSEIVKRLRA